MQSPQKVFKKFSVRSQLINKSEGKSFNNVFDSEPLSIATKDTSKNGSQLDVVGLSECDFDGSSFVKLDFFVIPEHSGLK